MNKTITTATGKKTALENTKADTFRRQLRLRTQDNADYESLVQHLCPHDQEVYFKARWDGRTLDLTEIPKPAAIEQPKETTNAPQKQQKAEPHRQAEGAATDKNGQAGGASAQPNRELAEVSGGVGRPDAKAGGGTADQQSDNGPAVDVELDAILKLEKPQREAELKTLAPTRGVKWDAKASIDTMIEKIRKAKK